MIIDKPSVEAYEPPYFANASHMEASATAALKRPAKLLDLNRTPRMENKEAIAPPMIALLIAMSEHILLSLG